MLQSSEIGVIQQGEKNKHKREPPGNWDQQGGPGRAEIKGIKPLLEMQPEADGAHSFPSPRGLPRASQGLNTLVGTHLTAAEKRGSLRPGTCSMEQGEGQGRNRGVSNKAHD